MINLALACSCLSPVLNLACYVWLRSIVSVQLCCPAWQLVSCGLSTTVWNQRIITPPRRCGVLWSTRLFVCASVCVSVCLSSSISLEPLDRSSRNFCADPLWLWLGPPLAALRRCLLYLHSTDINVSMQKCIKCINPLKCSGVRQLYIKVFSAI